MVEHFEAAKEREQKLEEIRAMIAKSEEEYARGEAFELTEELIEQWKIEGRARQANRG